MLNEFVAGVKNVWIENNRIFTTRTYLLWILKLCWLQTCKADYSIWFSVKLEGRCTVPTFARYRSEGYVYDFKLVKERRKRQPGLGKEGTRSNIWSKFKFSWAIAPVLKRGEQWYCFLPEQSRNDQDIDYYSTAATIYWENCGYAVNGSRSSGTVYQITGRNFENFTNSILKRTCW